MYFYIFSLLHIGTTSGFI